MGVIVDKIDLNLKEDMDIWINYNGEKTLFTVEEIGIKYIAGIVDGIGRRKIKVDDIIELY